MNDKDIKKSVQNKLNSDLQFTKEDKEKVFQKIQRQEEKQGKFSFLQNFRHRAAPLMAMAVLISISFVLLYSFIDTGFNQQADHSDRNQAGESEDFSSMLFILKDESRQTDFHMLITYSQDKGAANLMVIPEDTAVQTQGTSLKLSSVYASEENAESVKNAVSDALGLPIEDYAMLDLKDFAYIMSTIDKTELTVSDEKVVTFADGKEINLFQGTMQLNGNEAVSLLSAEVSNEEGGWTFENREQLSESVLKNLLKNIRPTHAGELFKLAETNTEIEKVIAELARTKFNEMDTVSLSDHVEHVILNEKSYLKLNNLDQIKKEMTSFD